MLESAKAFVIFMLPPDCESKACQLRSALGLYSASRDAVGVTVSEGRPPSDISGGRLNRLPDGSLRYRGVTSQKWSSPHRVLAVWGRSCLAKLCMMPAAVSPCQRACDHSCDSDTGRGSGPPSGPDRCSTPSGLASTGILFSRGFTPGSPVGPLRGPWHGCP